MDSELTENLGDTVRLTRPPPRVFTVARSRNVWLGEVRAPDLELEAELETADYDPYNSAHAPGP